MADVLDQTAKDVKVQFFSIEKFKEDQGIRKIQILRNPRTKKLFAVADEDITFRVKSDLNFAKPMCVGIFDGEWCILNRGIGAEELAML